MTSHKCPICNQAASKLCSACHGVSYCSVDHQKKHWKTHKKQCRSWAVLENPVLGRYMVAARDISPGTVIMSEETLMIGPKQDTKPLCLGCYKGVDGSYFCSKCNLPLCGPSCEKVQLHAQNECAVFSRSRSKVPKITNFEVSHPLYECILTLRCLLLQRNNSKKWTQLLQMEPHNAIRKQLKELWHRNQVNVVQFLRDRHNLAEICSEELVHTVLGFGDVNSFEIRAHGIVDICGLYDNIYIMAHNCVSNTHHTVTADFKMVVRAVVPIPKGEMITTVYTHTLDGTLDRRVHLKESKFFDCVCERCKDPTEFGTYLSALKCQEESDKGPCKGYSVPQDPLSYSSSWKCTTCGGVTPLDQVSSRTKAIKDQLEEIKEGPRLIPQLEGVLEEFSGKRLHPNHSILIGVVHSLSELYGRVEGWRIDNLSMDQLVRKEKHCRHLMEVLDVVEPGKSRIRGLTMYELHAAIYFIAQRKFQNGAMSKEQLEVQLKEVMRLLKEAEEILKFDGTHTPEGNIGRSISESIVGVETVMKHCCN